MKKLIGILLGLIILFTSCVGSRNFIVQEYKENEYVKTKIRTVERYGVLNPNQKQDDVIYQVSAGNVILSILTVHTIIIPAALIGFFLYKPVAVIENGEKILKEEK